MPLFLLHGQYQSISTYIQNFKFLAFFCDCVGPFVSDLVEPQIVVFLLQRLSSYFMRTIEQYFLRNSLNYDLCWTVKDFKIFNKIIMSAQGPQKNTKE